MFDAAIHLWLDSASSTVGEKVCRNRVAMYYRCFRKACSTYIKNIILPYLDLPGPVEIDESKIGAQRWSHLGRFPKKLRWVVGMICRKTKIPIIYYVDDKKHDTLAHLFKKHISQGAVVLSDCHPSYVKLKSSGSKLAQYGWFHFWINHSESFVHDKFSFVHTNNIERNWRALKSSISYIKYSVKEERITEYLHSFMLRQICSKDKLYFMMLKVLRQYYCYHMASYLQRNKGNLHYLPNICAIDSSYYNEDGTTIVVKEFHGEAPPSLDPSDMDERDRFRFGFVESYDICDRE